MPAQDSGSHRSASLVERAVAGITDDDTGVGCAIPTGRQCACRHGIGTRSGAAEGNRCLAVIRQPLLTDGQRVGDNMLTTGLGESTDTLSAHDGVVGAQAARFERIGTGSIPVAGIGIVWMGRRAVADIKVAGNRHAGGCTVLHELAVAEVADIHGTHIDRAITGQGVLAERVSAVAAAAVAEINITGVDYTAALIEVAGTAVADVNARRIQVAAVQRVGSSSVAEWLVAAYY